MAPLSRGTTAETTRSLDHPGSGAGASWLQTSHDGTQNHSSVGVSVLARLGQREHAVLVEPRHGHVGNRRSSGFAIAGGTVAAAGKRK
jgi:hypothetical protein